MQIGEALPGMRPPGSPLGFSFGAPMTYCCSGPITIATLSPHRCTKLCIDYLGSRIKVFKKSGAKPSFHFQCGTVVPVSTQFFPPPLERHLKAGKRFCREEKRKSGVGMGNVLHHAINDGVRTRHEGLLCETHSRIIKHPSALKLIWVNSDDRVHGCALIALEWTLNGAGCEIRTSRVQLGGWCLDHSANPALPYSSIAPNFCGRAPEAELGT